MKSFIWGYSILAGLVLFMACSVKQKMGSTDYSGIDSVAAYDPYALESSDSASMQIPDDAIVVTASPYRSTFTIVNKLVHTKLDVNFDWEQQQLHGKAWITLSPYYYATDSLRLDAKGFDIHKLELVQKGGNLPLKYDYDSSSINITLNRFYSNNERYTVYMEYTAKPSELQVKGSAAINDARGLYFINHDGKDTDKPRELWTQGETESNSAWFPTIDKPNMKMTTELSMTVENGFVTLSNGLMVSTKDNKNGTHTDTWKMDLPYAPYLVMMAAGPFSIVKDHWNKMEVNYYVDKKYEPYARKVFGETPHMIGFFSSRLGVPYAWPKYSQVVVHDFVSGAMENVTATVFFEVMNKTSREMINGWREDIIAHELFHQWFGDLVTCESWSNISLNESFANYGEYLWNEHKYGKQEADYRFTNDLEDYIYTSKSVSEPLIRFNYNDREEVFDGISYQKGGRILHMLRNYVGDEAFFASLKKYLMDNKFGTGEVHQLRLAFESVTGQDLNWFFNQWYLSKGHPVLDITYYFNADSKEEVVNIDQLQDTYDGVPVFRIPLNIDVYENGTVKRYSKVITTASQSFSFPCATEPDLVNVDADKILVCEKTDHHTDTAFAFQMEHAPQSIDRLEALQYFKEDSGSPFYLKVMLQGMNDKLAGLRSLAVESIHLSGEDAAEEAVKQKIMALAKADSSSQVRAAAIEKLVTWKNPEVTEVLKNALKDSSYLVISTALKALAEVDSVAAMQSASALEADSTLEIVNGLAAVYAKMAGPEKNDFFLKEMKNSGVSYYTVVSYGQYLYRMADQPAVIEPALPALYNISEKNSKWYVRLASTSALENIYTAMDAYKETWTNELVQSGLSTEQRHIVQSKLEWITNQMSMLREKTDSIKDAETNENLKMMYGR